MNNEQSENPKTRAAVGGPGQFVKKLNFNIFSKDMCLGKNSFCRTSVPQRGARRATAGKFSLNFAKFSENFPHAPLVGKARQGFFDRLGPPSAVRVLFCSIWVLNLPYKIGVHPGFGDGGLYSGGAAGGDAL